jgi:hypothetical protein
MSGAYSTSEGLFTGIAAARAAICTPFKEVNIYYPLFANTAAKISHHYFTKL